MSHTLSACLPRLTRPLPMPHALMGSTSLPEQHNERRQLPDRDQHVTFPSSLLARASNPSEVETASLASLGPSLDDRPYSPAQKGTLLESRQRVGRLAGWVNKGSTFAVNRHSKFKRFP